MYDPVNHVVDMVNLTDRAIREVKFGQSTLDCITHLNPNGMRIRRLRNTTKLLRELADAIDAHTLKNTDLEPSNEVAA